VYHVEPVDSARHLGLPLGGGGDTEHRAAGRCRIPDVAIREHFAQFGRITRLFRSKDKTFTKAANGIVHLSIAVAPGFTLPAFVTLADPEGGVDKRMMVYTDASRRRCSSTARFAINQ